MAKRKTLISQAAKIMGSKGGTNRGKRLSKQRLSEIGYLGGKASAKSKQLTKARGAKNGNNREN